MNSSTAKPMRLSTESVTIATRDGVCPAYVFKPSGKGPWPAAIFLMDGFGMRPTMTEMAQRLADSGYLVLLPDLFYRKGRYEPLDVEGIFSRGKLREEVGAILGPSPDNRTAASDAAGFLAYLSTHPDIKGKKVGVTGYCMSGGMSLTIAGTYPDQIAAAACFHGGLLVSDSEMSPHLLAPAIKGEIYVAGAETDPYCPPEMVRRLDEILTAAHVRHRCEVYEGTMHGWNMRDSPVYNEKATERHWRKLLALFASALN